MKILRIYNVYLCNYNGKALSNAESVQIKVKSINKHMHHNSFHANNPQNHTERDDTAAYHLLGNVHFTFYDKRN